MRGREIRKLKPFVKVYSYLPLRKNYVALILSTPSAQIP